jgi:membrane glycosyltransferase
MQVINEFWSKETLQLRLRILVGIVLLAVIIYSGVWKLLGVLLLGAVIMAGSIAVVALFAVLICWIFTGDHPWK